MWVYLGVKSCLLNLITFCDPIVRVVNIFYFVFSKAFSLVYSMHVSKMCHYSAGWVDF